MKTVLTLIAVASWALAALVFVQAMTVIHQLLAAILFLAGVVCIVGNAVLSRLAGKVAEESESSAPSRLNRPLPGWVGLATLGLFLMLIGTCYVAVTWFAK